MIGAFRCGRTGRRCGRRCRTGWADRREKRRNGGRRIQVAEEPADRQGAIPIFRQLLSLEAVDVARYEANPAGQLAAVAESERQAPIAESVAGIARLAASVKQENASRVVDENGEPLVVWHGSNSEFWKFAPELVGENYGNDEEGVFLHRRQDDRRQLIPSTTKRFYSRRA